MEYKDYYKILGIGKSATQADIKKAYKKLAVQYHPDKNSGDIKAEEKFKEINEAKEVLGNPENRKKYDQLGSNWRQYEQSGRHGDFDWSKWQQRDRGQSFYQEDASDMFGEGFSDFFSNIFGGGAGFRSNRKRESTPYKGQDYEVSLNITLEEAYHGTTKVLEFDNNKIRINCKPGTKNGQVLRVKGKGYPGINNGPPGDLHLRVHVMPHHIYKREGNDLFQNVNIDLYTAVLGGKTEINTFSGPVNFRIPAGCQNGKKLRLKGKGMPVYNKKDEFGSMIVELNIVIPQDLSGQQIELFERLRDMQYHKEENFI